MGDDPVDLVGRDARRCAARWSSPAPGPRPVGSGAEMWNASAVSAPPMTSAIGVAPRSSACSADSTTTTPAPSPSTKPSRVASNGRDAVSGESLRFDRAPMLASAATPIDHTGASEPPASTTSHSPVAISRSASWNAMTDVAHAATCVITGPVRPYSIDSMQPAIEPDSAGIANGDTKRGPFWSWTCVPVDDLLDPAAARVHDHADAVALLRRHRREVDARRLDRLLARAHRQVDEPAHAADHLGVHGHARVVVEHLGRDLHLEPGRVERLDPAGAGHGVAQVRPVGLEVVADRHHGAEAGHDGATRGISGGHGIPFLVWGRTGGWAPRDRVGRIVPRCPGDPKAAARREPSISGRPSA